MSPYGRMTEKMKQKCGWRGKRIIFQPVPARRIITTKREREEKRYCLLSTLPIFKLDLFRNSKGPQTVLDVHSGVIVWKNNGHLRTAGC